MGQHWEAVAVAHGIIMHISVVWEARPVTEGSESQSVRYENVFSVLYDVIGFTTLPPHLVEEKSDKAEL